MLQKLIQPRFKRNELFRVHGYLVAQRILDAGAFRLQQLASLGEMDFHNPLVAHRALAAYQTLRFEPLEQGRQRIGIEQCPFANLADRTWCALP